MSEKTIGAVEAAVAIPVPLFTSIACSPAMFIAGAPQISQVLDKHLHKIQAVSPDDTPEATDISFF